ncbi:MAG: selenocysteine-specific translation elongation factor [Polyangiaceae bacterium]|nr:selenocysteine-specific translation elongation factor [Polyangiaceae bacterium]
MRRFVIGTAGHVDHGKTTLVHALTGVDTDRLPEEKKRGITIELGFAPWQIDPETAVSIIDVPGHRRLVHTMIAGAVGMELVLLVVAADEGVMPQTREHIAACELLGVRRAVVAITKADRVERELAELAGEEVSELLRGRIQHDVVVCSAKTGEGLDALRAKVKHALSELAASSEPVSSGPAHLSVDRAFSVKGAGTVVTGTLVRGAISAGDALFLVGASGPRTTAARGLHVHDKATDRAEAPTRLALNLAGLSVEDVSRGDVVTSDASVRPSHRFDAKLTMLREVRASAALEVYVGTARAPGRLQIVSPAEELEDGTVVQALGRVRLEQPLVVTGGDRFVLRGGTGRGTFGAVVGGGVVLDARPPAMRDKRRRRKVLAALLAGDVGATARTLVAERAPRPLGPADLEGRFPVSGPAIARAADKAADKGEIVRIKDEGFVDKDALLALARRARELTRAHHAGHPLDRGIKLETLRQRLAERAGLPAALEAIRQAGRKSLEGDPLVVEGDIARIEGFVDGAAPAAGGPVGKAQRALEEAALKGMGEHAVLELLGVPVKEVRAVLAKLVRDGLAIATGGQWFAAAAVEKLRADVLAHFAKAEVLTIAQFKDLSGLGRKQAIPLLELFDREGTSLRKGDDRVAGPKARAKV